MAVMEALFNGRKRGLNVIIFFHSLVPCSTILEPYTDNTYFQASLVGKLLLDKARGFRANLVGSLEAFQLLCRKPGAWSLLVAFTGVHVHWMWNVDALCEGKRVSTYVFSQQLEAFLQDTFTRATYNVIKKGNITKRMVGVGSGCCKFWEPHSISAAITLEGEDMKPSRTPPKVYL